MRITIVLALTSWIFLSSCGLVYAQEDNIGQSILHPAHPLYFLKTIRESLELKFAGTTRVRMLRELEFATRRLRETKTLISINQDLIPPTLEKYASHINTLPDKDLKDQEVSTRIKESLTVHLDVLQKIYHQVSNPRAKIAIRSAINRIIQRVDVPIFAKLPGCRFFAKEATSSSLNQTESAVYLERAQKCLKGLGPGSF